MTTHVFKGVVFKPVFEDGYQRDTRVALLSILLPSVAYNVTPFECSR